MNSRDKRRKAKKLREAEELRKQQEELKRKDRFRALAEQAKFVGQEFKKALSY